VSETAAGRGGPLLGILVTHGRLGEELLRTAEEILGPQTRIAVASNVGHSHASLAAHVERLAAPELEAGEAVVILVDLLPGSCGVACRALAARHPGVLLAGGVNLPMLLEFLHQRAHVGRRELRARLEQKGRAAIACLGWDDAT
jgi:mannose/fructose-specific phosphotransferase system component IIA